VAWKKQDAEKRDCRTAAGMAFGARETLRVQEADERVSCETARRSEVKW